MSVRNVEKDKLSGPTHLLHKLLLKAAAQDPDLLYCDGVKPSLDDRPDCRKDVR